MNLPEYETKAVPEASWGAVVGALVLVAGQAALRLGADPEFALTIAALVGAVARWLPSYLLPAPKTPPAV